MNYADFGAWFFTAKLAGCFIAFAIALRGSRDSQLMAFIYGAWTAFVYTLAHTLLTDPMNGLRAPQILGYWWYLFQAIVAIFPVACVWSLQDAGARKTIVVLGLVLVAVNLVFFSAAAPWLVGHRLPGRVFFDVTATLESLQVLALISLSVVARKKLRGLGHWIVKLWRWPWTDHKRLAAPRI